MMNRACGETEYCIHHFFYSQYSVNIRHALERLLKKFSQESLIARGCDFLNIITRIVFSNHRRLFCPVAQVVFCLGFRRLF